MRPTWLLLLLRLLQGSADTSGRCRSKSVSQAVSDAASASVEAAKTATSGLRQQAGQVLWWRVTLCHRSPPCTPWH